MNFRKLFCLFHIVFWFSFWFFWSGESTTCKTKPYLEVWPCRRLFRSFSLSNKLLFSWSLSRLLFFFGLKQSPPTNVCVPSRLNPSEHIFYSERDAFRNLLCHLIRTCLKLPVLKIGTVRVFKRTVMGEKSSHLCLFFLQIWVSRNSSELWNNVERMHQTWATCKNHFVVRTVLWFLQICRNVNIWYSFRCICHIQGNIKTVEF